MTRIIRIIFGIRNIFAEILGRKYFGGNHSFSLNKLGNGSHDHSKDFGDKFDKEGG